MKRILILDEQDIRQLIADTYNVELDKVELNKYNILQGYGPSEQEVTCVEAKITES